VSYDPKAALENLAEIDGGEFDLDDHDEFGNPTSGNSILDPVVQSQMLENDPDAVPADVDAAASEPADDETTAAANEDTPEPRPATPVTGTS
jgi:hypothetical protein